MLILTGVYNPETDWLQMFSHQGKWGGGDMNPDPKPMSQEMRLRGSVACKNAKQTKDTKVVRFPCSDDGNIYIYILYHLFKLCEFVGFCLECDSGYLPYPSLDSSPTSWMSIGN